MSDELVAREALKHFAEQIDLGEIVVRRASAEPDIRQDGSPVTRMMLVLKDPDGDTWGVEPLRELRTVLGRKAVELGLSGVSLTLLDESGPEAAEQFAER